METPATFLHSINRICITAFLLLAFIFIAPSAYAQNTDPATPAPPAPITADTNAADLAPMAPPVNMGNSPLSLPQPTPDLKDIRALISYPDYTLWIILDLLIVAIVVLLWFWFENRPARLAQSAYDQTLDKLAKAREILREDDPMPYAILISETIRTYLGQRFRTPSTRRTTEEFLRLMENDPATPLAVHRDLLREFLQSCDWVKFARYQPTQAELEKVHDRAVTFVTATKPPEPGKRNGVHP